MKIKVFIFLAISMLVITGAAFAMPQLAQRAPFHEPTAMLLVGAGLVGIACLGRKMFSDRS